MNKLSLTIRKILTGLGLLILFTPCLVLAEPAPNNTGTPTSTTPQKDGQVTEAELFYNFNYKNANTDTTKIGAVNRIVSTKTWQQVLADVIKILLNISGALALLALTLSGVMMISARGKADVFDKGKKILGYALAGLVIIAVSYAIVVGVSDLQFFTPGAGGGASSNTNSSASPSPSSTQPASTGAAQNQTGVKN